MSRAGDSLGADAQEVESRVSVQVGVTVQNWSHHLQSIITFLTVVVCRTESVSQGKSCTRHVFLKLAGRGSQRLPPTRKRVFALALPTYPSCAGARPQELQVGH